MESEVENQNDLIPFNTINKETELSLFYINEQVCDHHNDLQHDHVGKEKALAGVLCQGVQYYDFKNVLFINNNGLASLIRILKSSLKNGIKLKFVNVNKKIKNKIQTMGLDKFINCS